MSNLLYLRKLFRIVLYRRFRGGNGHVTIWYWVPRMSPKMDSLNKKGSADSPHSHSIEMMLFSSLKSLTGD